MMMEIDMSLIFPSSSFFYLSVDKTLTLDLKILYIKYRFISDLYHNAYIHNYNKSNYIYQ